MSGLAVHTCVRYGNGSAPFRSMCDGCMEDPREAALARGLHFLLDALDECGLTEDEMHAEPGTFYVRLLAAKSSLEVALGWQT